ncbi:MAG: DUF4331 domain-containing protein [Nevskiaceae bacterium]|nr:MAG: DUF4331 domain-containing protein [Nevskiaceae bacterium]
MRFKKVWQAIIAAGCATLASTNVLASSHREAPFIASMPKVDGTDFYMFKSYETGRSDFVTILANYEPLQDSYGGPNYFALDPEALYEIHIDNNGDAREDLTFQFRFTNNYKGIALPTGGTGNVAIPLSNAGQVDAQGTNLNVTETYTVNLVRGDRRSGVSMPVTNATDGSTTFTKPIDNIGMKSINDYASYANNFIYNVKIPGCNATGAKLFVGQRAEGFVVNLGQVFDLVNLSPLAARPGPGMGNNIIKDKNVTTLALEVPTACLTAGNDPVIGGWTTASVRQSRVVNPLPQGPANANGKKGPAIHGGAWAQVSRLGSPLVNEVVIGLTDKDKFNASQPKDDVQNFGAYVLYPTLPVLVDKLFFGGKGSSVPATPRNDLLAAFVTGVTTGPSDTPANFKFTAPATLTTPGEMLRLNTAIPAAAPKDQKDLGFLACDLAGFPNGRRPIDDVVDIELTVAEGALVGKNGLQTCDLSGPTPQVKNAGAVVNDGATPDPAAYLTVFPYLNTPHPGSP